MAKSLLVLSNKIETPTHQRLEQEAQKREFKLVFKGQEQLGHQTGPLIQKSSPLETEQFTSILIRDTGVSFDDFILDWACYQKNRGMRVFNDPTSMLLLRDKQKQTYFFQTHQLPIPPTFLLRGKPQGPFIKWCQENCPEEEYIVKTIRGNQGLGTNLIRGLDSLIALLETFWAMQDQRFIVQKKISVKEEWRFFFIKQKNQQTKNWFCQKKTSNGFRANAGSAQFLAVSETPSQVKQMAQKAFELSHLDFAAIDIIGDQEGEVYLLEINCVPGLVALETALEANIVSEIIDLIL